MSDFDLVNFFLPRIQIKIFFFFCGEGLEKVNLWRGRRRGGRGLEYVNFFLQTIQIGGGEARGGEGKEGG